MNTNKTIRINSDNQSGQVSLELAVAMIALVLVLMLGSFRMFIWSNQRLVRRQSDYESTRLTAGSTNLPTEVRINETNYPPLDILGTGN